MGVDPGLIRYLKRYFANDGLLELAEGAPIFLEGDPGDLMYVILEGSVELDVGGHTLAVLHAGETFGEMGLVDHSPRSATARAADDVRLVAIDEERFDQLLRDTPSFQKHMLRLLAHRVRQMDDRFRQDGC